MAHPTRRHHPLADGDSASPTASVTWYWMIKAKRSESLPPEKGGSGRENWSMKLALVNVELGSSRQETLTAGLLVPRKPSPWAWWS
jgi:hypothetical protein